MLSETVATIENLTNRKIELIERQTELALQVAESNERIARLHAEYRTKFGKCATCNRKVCKSYHW